MRVTENMRFLNTTYNLGNIKKKHEAVIEKLSSQKNINRLSDNPIGMTRLLDLRKTKTSLDQIKGNINHAKGFLSISETKLTAVSDLLIRAQELAIGQATGIATQESRAIAAKELQEIISELLTQANATFNDKYIFAGSKNSAPPFSLADPLPSISAVTAGSMNHFNGTVSAQGSFSGTANKTFVLQVTAGGALADAEYKISADGGLTWGGTQTGLAGPVNLGEGIELIFTAGNVNAAPNDTFILQAKAGGYYHGNKADLSVNLGRDITLSYNISGVEALGGQMPGGVDIFQVLIAFRDSLINNDTSAIQAAITGLNSGQNHILQAIATVGAKMNRLDLATDQVEALGLEIAKLTSEIEDANLEDLISRFTTSESALKASYQVAARVGNISLLDFLR